MNLASVLAQAGAEPTGWGYEWAILWMVFGVVALAMAATAYVSNRRPLHTISDRKTG